MTVSFSNVYMPPNILTRWNSTPDSHTARLPAFVFLFLLNDSHYPLTITKVRQALAYIIPQQSDLLYLREVERGWRNGSRHKDGLPNYLNKKYLTNSQLASLNTYSVNPSKATALLQAAGFHKASGKWVMPNGHTFKLSFLFNSANSDAVEVAAVAAKALTAFGIPSNVDATQGATVTSDEFDGNFQIGELDIGGIILFRTSSRCSRATISSPQVPTPVNGEWGSVRLQMCLGSDL